MTRPPDINPARRSVVFVSYNGLLDPLGSSQILPYLERLNPDWPIHIVSYERPDRLSDSSALEKMERRLQTQHIRWTRLKYHKWPSLPATTYDLVRGVIALRRILSRENVGLVHARGYLPTTIALRATRRHPVLFDIRGLQAEEYVDGGVWREGELKWRLAKRSEREFFRKAAGAVVLTHNIKPYVAECFSKEGRAPLLEVIPCCVDLGRFEFDAVARVALRAKLNVPDDTVLFVYSGSIGTWYLAEEMAAFVRAFREKTSRRCCLLWMVNNDADAARAASRKAGLSEDDVRVVSATPTEVPGWLSAADVGLALIKPSFSKRSSSPTKYAEYLAIGLPVVLSRGVGDSTKVEEDGGAVALDRFDAGALTEGAVELVGLLDKPRAHFREVARTLFDIDTVALPVYRSIYQRLATGPVAR